MIMSRITKDLAECVERKPTLWPAALFLIFAFLTFLYAWIVFP